jgi:DNA polymerase-1
VTDLLRRSGVRRGDFVAICLSPGVGVGFTADELSLSVASGDAEPVSVVAEVERALRPRWVWWSIDTAAALVRSGVRVATCWDVAAVSRLIFGGWRVDPARAWAQAHDLALDGIPSTGPLDLFSQADHDGSGADEPVRPDGHLDPRWVGGAWADNPERLGRWASLAWQAADRQRGLLSGVDRPAALATARVEPTAEVLSGVDRPAAASTARVEAGVDRPAALATARAESTAELLCAELAADGLPVDRAVAEAMVAAATGPRPRSAAEADELRARRDAGVLRHAPPGTTWDLRSPGQVKSLLRRVGIEVPDTRAWRLEGLRDAHPVVEALLAWRKAERVATTYGYAWLDENVAADGRLRGTWSGSDGAAGRMTASAGLHNMPADLRPAVVAEPGHVFVRADLGQIEPRVLAAVSGDAALAAATAEDDMYAPVAGQLGVDRETAKVAVLGAMYGQTTGHGAQVLRRLERAYPVAMGYLEDAARAGQAGRSVRTYGGRFIPMGSGDHELDERAGRSRAAARGRYARNAMVQGAAAELFKMWAVTVRARAVALDARIVLCLHDELLVHVPVEHGAEVARLVDDCLQEAAHRWQEATAVRFVADISTVARWSDAKG